MHWNLIALGCLGGLIPDMIRIVKGRYETELPKYLKSVNFLLGTSVLFFLGGLATWIGDATQAKEALAYGFAAPEIVSKLLASKPITLDKRLPFESIRRFWAF